LLTLEDIAEGRALLARAKAGEPGARQTLGAWFEAWGGLVLDMLERIHAPLTHPKRRFCPECGNRSFWPHASWCPGDDGQASTCSLAPAHNALTPGAQCPGCRFVAPVPGVAIGPFTREAPAATADRIAAHDQWLEAGTGEQRQKAQRRFDELQPEASAQFGGRPFMEPGGVATNPRAYSPKTVEVWYRAQGVEVSVIGGFLEGLLTQVIGLAPHACQECGHVNGGHRDGCQG